MVLERLWIRVQDGLDQLLGVDDGDHLLRERAVCVDFWVLVEALELLLRVKQDAAQLAGVPAAVDELADAVVALCRLLVEELDALTPVLGQLDEADDDLVGLADLGVDVPDELSTLPWQQVVDPGGRCGSFEKISLS